MTTSAVRIHSVLPTSPAVSVFARSSRSVGRVSRAGRGALGLALAVGLAVPTLATAPALADDSAPTVTTANIATTLPASGNGDGRLVFDVTSDVQGDLADWDIVLKNYASFTPADALIVNGDIVGGGTQEEYDDFFEVLNANDHAPTTLFTIGNHEFYAEDGTEAAIERFTANTGMPGVFWSTEVDGVPILGIGSTEEPGEWAVGNQVVLGQEQLDWLAAQLDAIPADQPVLLFGHHPLPDATSGTTGEGRQMYYDLDYREIDELLEILGDHPNVTFFSGHTHYSLHRADGTNRVAVPGGSEFGFQSVNTGAVQTEWGPNAGGPDQGEWGGETDFKQNLRVQVEGSVVTITYLDHLTKEVVRELRYDVTDPASEQISTDVPWPVAPADAVDQGTIPVTATIPGADDDGEGGDGPGAPGTGALALSVAEGGLELGNARNAGDRLRLGGALPGVSVTDTRADGGWSVTGQATDLVAGATGAGGAGAAGAGLSAGAAGGAGGAALVRAENLGWAPFVVSGEAQAGAEVRTALAGGAGLGAPAQLGGGVAGDGTAVLGADVALEVPVDTAAGTYTGAVTVSLFPQD